MEKVNKFFGPLQALKDVDLTIAAAEVVVVIGPSGSGKSTLCRTINRLEPIDSGQIRFDGRPLPEEGRALARLRADIGMVFQSFNLFAHMTVLDNVTLGPIKVRDLPKAQARAEARELLTAWESRRRPTSTRLSSRAGSSSGPPSPGRSPWTPSSCCSTSRPPRSTPR